MSFPTIEGARILAIGPDLRTPDDAYRVVRDVLDLGDGRPIFEALAAEHGAVVFEHFVPSWPECPPSPGILLRVRGAWAVLERDASQVGIASCAPLDPAIGWRFVALLADSPPDERDLPATGFVLEDPDRAGVWASERWRIRPHPLLARRPLGDWAWAWRRGSYGPVMITVRLQRTPDEIAEFLESCAPMPYGLLEPGRYAAPQTSGIKIFRELRICDGGLQLLRDFHDPPDELVEFDASLLLALADGALGALSWELVDGDYGQSMASGESATSLVDYLERAVEPEPP